MKSRIKVAGAGIVLLATIAALAGCAPAQPAVAKKATITVVSLIPGSKDEAFAAFDDQVKQF